MGWKAFILNMCETGLDSLLLESFFDCRGVGWKAFLLLMCETLAQRTLGKMQGHAFAGKGRQPHGKAELRGGEGANTYHDQMRMVWWHWHPDIVP